MAHGTPPLRRNSYKAWATIFSESFDDLRASSLRGHQSVMDHYGSKNPAEFFAVATETFFEKPHQLFDMYPDLYEELKNYYQIDPRSWGSPIRR
jgi:Mlc titration factor MtfA (ptsG expression regulator)